MVHYSAHSLDERSFGIAGVHGEPVAVALWMVPCVVQLVSDASEISWLMPKP